MRSGKSKNKSQNEEKSKHQKAVIEFIDYNSLCDRSKALIDKDIGKKLVGKKNE